MSRPKSKATLLLEMMGSTFGPSRSGKTDANLVKKYRKYRKVAMGLHQKIMKSCLGINVLMESGKLLGIIQDKVFMFDGMEETNVLMDFAFYEYKANGKNAVEIYREKVGGKNEIENEILDALPSSYTSLFKVASISKAEHALFLVDLLNEDSLVKLTDISFSETAIPGFLMFIRIVPLEDFNMTSGMAFVFPGKLRKYLLKRYKKLAKKVESDDESVKRFIKG